MAEIDLKPCPFCGGAAKLDAWPNSLGSGWYLGNARCSRRCGVEFTSTGKNRAVAQRNAAKRWNRRKP